MVSFSLLYPPTWVEVSENNKTSTAHKAVEVQIALLGVFPFSIPEHGMPSF